MQVNRLLVEDCCGWNKKLWADATIFALSKLDEDLTNKHVLEVGAGAYSTLAPIFVKAGATVVCSYYDQPRETIECGQLAVVSEKHNLDRPKLKKINIFDMEGIYDVIVMKSVLGGIGRANDCGTIINIIEQLLKNHVRQNGFIVSIDNGNINWLTKLRGLLGAGRNGWTYLEPTVFEYLFCQSDVRTSGFGFLNAGSMRFLFKNPRAELINDVLYAVDNLVVKLFKPKESAVLATCIQKTPGMRKLITDF